MTFNDYDLPISCYDVNKDYGFRTGYWKNKKLDEYSNDYLVKAMEYCADHNLDNKANEIYKFYKERS